MSYEPYTELSPIKSDKPVLDISIGLLHMNGGGLHNLIHKGTFYIHKEDNTCIKFSDDKITTITEEE